MLATLEERFWALVDLRELEPGGCWAWGGSKTARGYGRLWAHGRSIYAHRIARELHSGKIPEGLHVCHRCDNPECCNPAHLFTGTAGDNIRDAAKKGRLCRGTAVATAKLTPTSVRDIRARITAGEGPRRIAAHHGVGRETVRQIGLGVTWGWLG